MGMQYYSAVVGRGWRRGGRRGGRAGAARAGGARGAVARAAPGARGAPGPAARRRRGGPLGARRRRRPRPAAGPPQALPVRLPARRATLSLFPARRPRASVSDTVCRRAHLSMPR